MFVCTVRIDTVAFMTQIPQENSTHKALYDIDET